MAQFSGRATSISTWDMLKRSVPAGLNFTACGMPYWDTDIAGFFSPASRRIPPRAHTLVDPSDAKETSTATETTPNFLCAGSSGDIPASHARAWRRIHNEVWAYGKQAETILTNICACVINCCPIPIRLHMAAPDGGTFMRALFMDFPDDPRSLRSLTIYVRPRTSCSTSH